MRDCGFVFLKATVYMATYKCSKCGSTHEGPPLSYFANAPVYWSKDLVGKPGCRLDEETCIIDDSRYYVKANIELPIVDRDDKFIWTIWVSLSKSNFERAMVLWDDPSRVAETPYFGWLSSSIPGFSDTVNLKTNVHFRPPGQRPWVELEPTDHPLAVQQRKGIAFEQVVAYAESQHDRPDSL
jgi:hypothetical protein